MTAKRNIAGIEKLCQWYNYITGVLKLIVLFGVIMFCTLASQLELEMVFGTGGSIHTFTNVVVCTVCVLLEMVFIILNIHGIRTRQNDLIKAYILFSCIANASCIVAVFMDYVNYIYLHQHLFSKKSMMMIKYSECPELSPSPSATVWATRASPSSSTESELSSKDA